MCFFPFHRVQILDVDGLTWICNSKVVSPGHLFLSESCWASLTSGQVSDGSQGLPRFQAREVGSAEQLMLSRMPEGQLRQQDIRPYQTLGGPMPRKLVF